MKKRWNISFQQNRLIAVIKNTVKVDKVPIDVTSLKLPLVITVPVVSGNVTVLAAVGAVLVSVVIKLAPSSSISPVRLNCLVDLNLPTSTIAPAVCLVAKPIAVALPEPSRIAPILAALRKLLLDELTIKKISNTINYKKFDIDFFKRFPESHTNKVVGKDVESIIRSFQKELPTGFYTKDKENVKKKLKKVLKNGKCSKDVKEFLLKKVVPIKGSRYNFSKILQQNENRRTRNYYNKYLKGKYDTYEDYEKDYIKQQKALFDKVKKIRKEELLF